MKTIVDKILFLIPNAQFSIWDCNENEYQGELPPIKMGGYLICWNSTNTSACPTIADLDAVVLP